MNSTLRTLYRVQARFGGDITQESLHTARAFINRFVESKVKDEFNTDEVGIPSVSTSIVGEPNVLVCVGQLQIN